VQFLDVALVEVELADGGGDLRVGQHAKLRPARDQALDLLEFLKFRY